ncbi:MAG: hypothetical protein ABR591_00915 [Candidatus Velthaea sp.]
MIAAREPEANALVPSAHARSNVVQFASDGIAADVRISPADRRSGSAMYLLRLASLERDVTGRLVGVLSGGDAVELGGLAVAPGAVGSARVGVPRARGAAYESVYLEIRSHGVLLRVEAPKPVRARRTPALKIAGITLGAGMVALGGAFAATALPQTPLITPPARAVAGSAARVAYVTRGYGAVAYAAAFDDGTPIAAGTLAAPTGEIPLMLPAASARRRISVAVTQHGPLGAVVADASFAVSEPAPVAKPSAPARVLSFAVRRDQDAAGETILASYMAVADNGTIALQDMTGKRIASAPFAHVGTSRIRVGAAYRNAQLVAKIVARRGSSTAVASVVLAPAAVADTAPDETARPEAVTPVDAVSAQAASAGIVALDGRAVAGRPLRLRLTPRANPTHVELQDETGETLAETAVAPGAVRAVLPVPAEPKTQTYSLVVRYTRNGSEETVLRTIAVKPR